VGIYDGVISDPVAIGFKTGMQSLDDVERQVDALEAAIRVYQ